MAIVTILELLIMNSEPILQLASHKIWEIRQKALPL